MEFEELHILEYLENKKLKLFKDRKLRKLRRLLRLKETNPEFYILSDLQEKLDWLKFLFYIDNRS